MDTLLKNGDHVINHLGAPVMVNGVGELLQRAAIRLSVRRGSLQHNPLFGSRLHRAKAIGERSTLNAQVLAAVREALEPIDGIGVRSVRCVWNAAAQRLTVHVQLELYAREYALEVTV